MGIELPLIPERVEIVMSRLGLVQSPVPGPNLASAVAAAVGSIRPEMNYFQARNREDRLNQSMVDVAEWSPGIALVPIVPTPEVQQDRLNLEIVALFRAVMAAVGNIGSINSARQHLDPKKTIDEVRKVMNVVDSNSAGAGLTWGTEVEVCSQVGVKGVPIQSFYNIDTLQHMGVDVTYDGIREISWARSDGIYPQLEAWRQAHKSGVVLPGTRVNLHITIGNAPWRNRMRQTMEMRQIADGMDILGSATFYAGSKGFFDERLSLRMQASCNKYVYEYGSVQRREPAGLPLVMRTNGSVETRCWGYLPADGFGQMEQEFLRLEALAEACGGHVRLIEGESEDPDTDKQLSRLWTRVSRWNSSLLNQSGLPEADKLYAAVARKPEVTQLDVDRYAALRWQVVSRVNGSIDVENGMKMRGAYRVKPGGKPFHKEYQDMSQMLVDGVEEIKLRRQSKAQSRWRR